MRPARRRRFSRPTRRPVSRLEVEMLEGRLVPTTFMVVNTADGGAGSLRQAILDANADTATGTDTVQFNIPGAGAHTIALTAAPGALPTITRSLTIDGSTQPGFAGTPLVALDGSALDSVDGLTINAAFCTIKSLAVVNFTNGAGIVIGPFGATDLTNGQVAGCFLGVEADGTTAAPNDTGVRIDNGAASCLIGGLAGEGNVISGNREFGVAIGSSCANNTVAGNFIGLDFQGLAALPNSRIGIIISGTAHDNTIGGTTDGARNVISGNVDNALLLDGAGVMNNVIEGNYIGPDRTGNAVPTGNTNKPDAGAVVVTNGAKGNIIGGTDDGAGNVIAGNGSHGVVLNGAGTSNNVVAGNRIGVAANGSALANDGDGVFIINASDNLIGSFATGLGHHPPVHNILSGNVRHGVTIFGAGATRNRVLNNYIGTDADGAHAVPNGDDGVRIDGAPGNTVQGNVISGNSGGTQNGLSIVNAGADGNKVVGNRIGVAAVGDVVLGNAAAGIDISGGAKNNTVGGTVSTDANIISGNGDHGVSLGDATTTGNVIEGNFIGTSFPQTIIPTYPQLGNTGDGVHVVAAPGNTIGGKDPGTGNTIYFNTDAGVFVTDATGVSILGNSIFKNSNLGINSPPGTLDQFPTLTRALSSPQGTIISGTLPARDFLSYRVEFFSSTEADPSGSGQGQLFLGAVAITKASSHAFNVSFEVNVPGVVAPGAVISATATGGDGTTSRFSNDVVAVANPEAFNHRYVQAVYRKVLGRDADPRGAAFWTAFLDHGHSRRELSQRFVNSLEARTRLVQDLYFKYLGRPVDPVGRSASVGFLFAGGTVEQLKAVILGSPEFFHRAGGTNDVFVQLVFVQVLDRTIDPAARTGFNRALAQGVSRSEVASAVLTSLEAHQLLVLDLYLTILGRDADARGLVSFTSALQHGTRDEDVMIALLASAEFAGRL